MRIEDSFNWIQATPSWSPGSLDTTEDASDVTNVLLITEKQVSLVVLSKIMLHL
jgi:hypothetical protein